MLAFTSLFAGSPTRRKPQRVSVLGHGLENYEDRMMLSATVATVQPAAEVTGNFNGTWNLTAESTPSGTVVIVQTEADASANINFAGINTTVDGTVKGNTLTLKSEGAVAGVEVKKVKAKLTDETHFKGKAKAVVDGLGKVVIKFNGELQTTG